MKDPNAPIVKQSLFSWVLTSSIKLQVTLVLIILVTVIARVIPLEMQKRIVNEAISLSKFDLLLLYCGIYLAAVIFASFFKFLINYIQTIIAQRALEQMRKGLYHHILTLPLNFFRKTQPGMVVSSLITELTTAGNFVGMAIAVPVTNILTLVAFAGYLIWLHPLLGLVSLSIYPIVLFIIPLLQKRANIANKKRVDTTRSLSSNIGEAISGVHEIHGNGAYEIENNKFDRLAEKLLKIRIRWTLLNESIKQLNNLFNSLSPFLIFLLGGYLAMTGQLELGALVAFLSAQEKLYDPWKELIGFYQVYQDASVRYYRTMEYFDEMPDHELAPVERSPFDLSGNIDVQNLSFTVEGGIRLLNDISFSMKPGEHLALVGFSGSGKSTLAQCIGQLYKYTDGHIRMDTKEVSELTKKDMIRNVGFVAQSPFIFSGSIEENLLYGCMAKTGHLETDSDGQLPTLDDRIAVLHQTGIFVDVLRFGLNTVVSHDEDDQLVSALLRVRKNFQKEYGEVLSEYVEFFDESKYLYYSSVSENLIFGAANEQSFLSDDLHRNDYFKKFLDEAQLTRPLLGLGAQLAEQIVDILGNLTPDAVFFEQSPIQSHELDAYKKIVERMNKVSIHELTTKNQDKLLQVGLRFTPGIHKMVALPDLLEKMILDSRALFKEKVTKEYPEAFTFYQISQYIFSQTILNNIFFGKMKTVNPKAQDKINQSIIQLLIEEDFLEKILEIGMQFEVGSKGDKLSGGQRQKLAIARAFLKQPKVLIMDEATSALDNKSQARIQNLLSNKWKGSSTLIAVVHRLDIIKEYDRVAVMKAGKIEEIGTYDELISKKGMLYELEYGKK